MSQALALRLGLISCGGGRCCHCWRLSPLDHSSHVASLSELLRSPLKTPVGKRAERLGLGFCDSRSGPAALSLIPKDAAASVSPAHVDTLHRSADRCAGLPRLLPEPLSGSVLSARDGLTGCRLHAGPKHPEAFGCRDSLSGGGLSCVRKWTRINIVLLWLWRPVLVIPCELFET